MKTLVKKRTVPIIFLVFLAMMLIVLPLVSSAQTPGTTGSTVTPGTTGTTPTPGTTGNTNTPGTTGTTITPGTRIELKNPLTVDSIGDLLKLILQIVIIFAVPIVVFMIMYSGFLYVTAQGKPDQITKATKAFTWTIIGAVIVLGAQVLLTIITNTVHSLMPPT